MSGSAVTMFKDDHKAKVHLIDVPAWLALGYEIDLESAPTASGAYPEAELASFKAVAMLSEDLIPKDTETPTMKPISAVEKEDPKKSK